MCLNITDISHSLGIIFSNFFISFSLFFLLDFILLLWLINFCILLYFLALLVGILIFDSYCGMRKRPLFAFFMYINFFWVCCLCAVILEGNFLFPVPPRNAIWKIWALILMAVFISRSSFIDCKLLMVCLRKQEFL